MDSPNNRIEKRRVDSLRIHPSAQRLLTGLTKAKLNKIIAELDLDAIGTLHAVECEIDGVFAAWVIDGCHRHTALMHHGFGEWEVYVEFHDDVRDAAQASRLFRKLNFRSGVPALDDFDQAYREGDPAAVGATAILEKHGYKVGKTQSDRTIASPATILKVYGLDDGESLDQAFTITLQAWGHQTPATEGKIIEGLGRFFAVYNGAVDSKSLVPKLSKYPGGPAAILGAARAEHAIKQKSVVGAVVDILRGTYNKGRQTRLL